MKAVKEHDENFAIAGKDLIATFNITFDYNGHTTLKSWSWNFYKNQT